jgi:hypothetical protein
MGFELNRVALARIFSQHFSFLLPIIIPPVLSVIRGWYGRLQY